MFDTLLSADLSVDDPDRVASVLVDKLSLPEPQPSWVHNWPESQYRAYFLRANSRRVGAPTAIEVIGPHPETGLNAGLRAIHDRQGARPMKTHSTVFSVPDVLAVADRLRGRGVPVRLRNGPDDANAFPRLWPGQSDDDPGFYDSRYDGGLVVEFVPTAVIALRPASLARTVDPDIPPGAPVRVESRSFIVDDLDATVAALDRYLDLQPAHLTTSARDGARVARYEGSIAASAALELLQPVADGVVAEHQGRFGAGAYRITLAVNGLDAAARRLDERGAGYVRLDPLGDEPARLRVDQAALAGAIFELVDA